MMNFPWLTVLWLTPIVGSVILASLPRARVLLAKQVALGLSLLTFVISVVMLTQYDFGGSGYQLTETHSWIATFGAHYALGLNGIGITLIMLTTILLPIVILASWHDGDKGRGGVPGFFAWMLALEGLALGVFSATDVFLFYVLFEATLIPIYFLIGSYGGAHRSYAAIKFLLYSLAGGLLMLASVVGLYVVSSDHGTPSYLLSDLMQIPMGETTERWLFLGFLVAFAIQAPMWPVHTWLPDAAAAGTPGTSVLLVSILDKIGTFGMLRFCLGLFPDASRWASPVVIILAVISILYGALLAIGQDDMRRLIAYTSVSHFGLIVLGVFAFTSASTTGSTLYMFNHGISTAGLFLITGFMISRRGSARISDFGGMQKLTPVLGGVFLLIGLSTLSLPGLAPFVSEFLVLVGTFTTSITAAVFATLAVVLAAIYILWMYQRTMTGPLRPEHAGVTDLNVREIAALAPAVVLLVGLGFFPQPLLHTIHPAVESALHHVGVKDPPPRTSTPTAEGSNQ